MRSAWWDTAWGKLLVRSLSSAAAALLACETGFAAAQRAAAPDLDIAAWSADTGLPSDSVTSIHQTPEGFLWVGTSQGMVRFDGWKFTPVSFSATAKASPTGNIKITAQCVDSSGKLWAGTERHGLFRLDPGVPPPIRAVGMGLEEQIHALGADSNGSVWIGTETGLTRWHNGRFSRVQVEAGLAEAAVLALQVSRSNIWITSRGGLRRLENGLVRKATLDPDSGEAGFRGVYEGGTGSLWYFGGSYLLQVTENRRFNYFRGGGTAPLHVWNIAEGRDRQLWIGTSGQGLFNFREGRFHPVDLKQDQDHSDTQAVFIDQDEQIWVGSKSGLLRLREPVVRWFGSGAGPATCLAQDTYGRVWAGFLHGGLYSGTAESLDWAAEMLPVGAQNLITSIYIRPTDSTFWMGTLGQGLLRVRQGKVQRYGTGQGISEDQILAVCGGADGRVWVSTPDGRVHRFIEHLVGSFDTSYGLTGDAVTAMIPSGKGGLLVGTSQGDVLRFQDDQFRKLPPALKQEAPVTALCEETSRLWVGTFGLGIRCFDGARWHVLRKQMGLPDDRVLAIERGPDGELWVATAVGISRLPETLLQQPSESRREEPLSVEHATPLAVEFPAPGAKAFVGGWPRSLSTRQGLLWFATDSGVARFNPSRLPTPRSAVPVHIETIRANGLPLSLDRKAQELTLPANLREVLIRFTTPSIASPEKTRFRHRLEGFDPGWVNSSETRFAQYGRLPAGDYTFKVQSSDRDGVWDGPETAIILTVPIPMWRAPLVLFAEALLLIGVVAMIVRAVSHRRLRLELEHAERQRAMERERSRIAQDMHDELGAKLTKISFMSEQASEESGTVGRESTAARLDTIAATSRDLLQSLDEIVWAVNPRNDTLESLAAYLGQYASEYIQNTSIELSLQMPAQLPEAVVPAEIRHNTFLAFEEALGNALKHSGATRINVSMGMEGNGFKVTVGDNGRGFDCASLGRPSAVRRRRGGTGVPGMRERMEKSGGRCTIEGVPNSGTIVTLSIPTRIQDHGN